MLDRFAKVPALLWVTFPCTGGPVWQDRNWRHDKPDTQRNICSNWSGIRELWKSFNTVVLPHVHCTKFHIAWEWPYTCTYREWHEGAHAGDGTPHIPFIDAIRIVSVFFRPEVRPGDFMRQSGPQAAHRRQALCTY